MIDLISEIGQKSKLLDAAVQELGKRGRSYAQSEQEYRIALAKRILDERSKGTPVTIISDICRGDREIAKLRFRPPCDMNHRAPSAFCCPPRRSPTVRALHCVLQMSIVTLPAPFVRVSPHTLAESV